MRERVIMRDDKPGFLEDSRGEGRNWRIEDRGTTSFTGTGNGRFMTSFETHKDFGVPKCVRVTVRGGDHAQCKRGGMPGSRKEGVASPRAKSDQRPNKAKGFQASTNRLPGTQ